MSVLGRRMLQNTTLSKTFVSIKSLAWRSPRTPQGVGGGPYSQRHQPWEGPASPFPSILRDLARTPLSITLYFSHIRTTSRINKSAPVRPRAVTNFTQISLGAPMRGQRDACGWPALPKYSKMVSEAVHEMPKRCQNEAMDPKMMTTGAPSSTNLLRLLINASQQYWLL
jgi:hypothetical protein